MLINNNNYRNYNKFYNDGQKNNNWIGRAQQTIDETTCRGVENRNKPPVVDLTLNINETKNCSKVLPLFSDSWSARNRKGNKTLQTFADLVSLLMFGLLTFRCGLYQGLWSFEWIPGPEIYVSSVNLNISTYIWIVREWQTHGRPSSLRRRHFCNVCPCGISADMSQTSRATCSSDLWAVISWTQKELSFINVFHLW